LVNIPRKAIPQRAVRTWLAMFGNGLVACGEKTSTSQPLSILIALTMGVKMKMQAITWRVCCVAARTAVEAGFCVVRLAAGSIPPIGMSASVFVLCAFGLLFLYKIFVLDVDFCVSGFWTFSAIRQEFFWEIFPVNQTSEVFKTSEVFLLKRYLLLLTYFPALSFAALSNPTNNGCGFMGRDKNSGWN
jgi:hypothetical protein